MVRTRLSSLAKNTACPKDGSVVAQSEQNRPSLPVICQEVNQQRWDDFPFIQVPHEQVMFRPSGSLVRYCTLARYQEDVLFCDLVWIGLCDCAVRREEQGLGYGTYKA